MTVSVSPAYSGSYGVSASYNSTNKTVAVSANSTATKTEYTVTVSAAGNSQYKPKSDTFKVVVGNLDSISFFGGNTVTRYQNDTSNMFVFYAKATSGKQLYATSSNSSKASCDNAGSYVSSGKWAGYYSWTVTIHNYGYVINFNVYTSSGGTYAATSDTYTLYAKSIWTEYPAVKSAYATYEYNGQSQGPGNPVQYSTRYTGVSDTFFAHATISGKYTDVGAGAKIVTFTLDDTTAYADHESVHGAEWVISPKPITVSAPSAKTGLVYTGSAQSLVNAGSFSGQVSGESGTSVGTFTYKIGSAPGSQDTGIPTATNAGSYTVYWKFTPNNNYTTSNTTSGTVTVTILAAYTLTASVTGATNLKS